MLTRRDLLFGAAAAAAAFRRQPTPASVSFLMPSGATDCHAHIFCDAKAFPMSAGRSYTPDPALVPEYVALARRLNIERVVLIQPSIYGTDNDCMLAAMREFGFRARGIAVIDDQTTDAAIDAMIHAGVRGIRINLETTGQADPAVARERFQAAVKRIGARKLHIQIFTRPSVIAAIKDLVDASPVPVVFDHFGGAQGAGGVAQPGFDALVSLVQSGKAYVKLSGAYRGSTQAPEFPDMAPLAKALVAANLQRILWGTDWPHANTNPDARNAETGTNPRLSIDDV